MKRISPVVGVALPVPSLVDMLIRSIQVGSLYALMATGLALTMAVIKLPNVAHIELITLGAYIALIASLLISPSLLLLLSLAFIGSALIALAHYATGEYLK